MAFNAPRSATILIIVLVIAAISFGAIWIVTNAMERRGEWAATESLLPMTQAPRETSYPGVAAWLQKLLHQYCTREAGPDIRSECEQALNRLDGFPAHMSALSKFLNPQPVSAPNNAAPVPTVEVKRLHSAAIGRMCIAEFKVDNRRYAMTRPELGRGCESTSDTFVPWAISALDARHIPEAMDVPPFGKLTPERAYIIAQDGALISTRFSDHPATDEDEGREYHQFVDAAKRDGTPAVVSVRSFYSMVKSSGTGYTGAYLDITDLGVVSTAVALVPSVGAGNVVIAVDAAFGTGWIQRLSQDDRSLFLTDVTNDLTWSAVAAQAATRGDTAVKSMAQRCGGADSSFSTVALCANAKPSDGGMIAAIRIGNGDSVEGKDTNRWLIAWLPVLSSPLRLAEIVPVLALILLGSAYLLADRNYRDAVRSSEEDRRELLRKAKDELDSSVRQAQAESNTALLTFERHRDETLLRMTTEHREALYEAEELRRSQARAAEDAQRDLMRQADAERAASNHRAETTRMELSKRLEDKREEARQQALLLENLSVPLVTIDPNDDCIRYQNAKARLLGLEDGVAFAHYVHAEDLPSYDRANKAAGMRERAYGVRLVIGSRTEQVIIRSSALAAPIDAIHGRQNDRVGLIALLSQEDTGQWQNRIKKAASDSERERCASFLDHGVKALAEIACRGRAALDTTVRPLLMTYLDRRVRVIADLFAGWEKPPEEDKQALVHTERAIVEKNLDMLQRLAAFVAQDRVLRGQLRWGNGVLSEMDAQHDPFPFTIAFDEWRSDLKLTGLIDGAESFVFEELIVNALKHGKPGRPPQIAARPHDNSRWVEFEIRNEVSSERIARAPDASHKYGGRRLVKEACRRLGWELLSPQFRDNIYSITVRASAMGPGGGSDLERLVDR